MLRKVTTKDENEMAIRRVPMSGSAGLEKKVLDTNLPHPLVTVALFVAG
jgi:hypothetical protein